MFNWEFAQPSLLFILTVIPLLIFLRYRKTKKKIYALKIPTTNPIADSRVLSLVNIFLYLIRLLAIALIILGLARPRILNITEDLQNEKGLDILLVVDLSLSMLAKDLKPDRISALREVSQTFVKERKTDRIGLVAYSGEAITKVPLTTDRTVLIEEIKNLKTQTLEGGTAIGVGLATAINHLKDSKAKNKIIVLMTDGVNNDGFIDPLVATDIAKSNKIKCYTIGIGTNGEALFPISQDIISGDIHFEKQPVEIDEKLLNHIANETGGKYFRATDNKTLNSIYENINKLEKSDIGELKFYNYTEKYRWFVIPALVLLLIELLIRTFYFKSINE